MKPTLDIDVKIHITDETAVLCAGLLDMFCDMRTGDLDIGYETCNGCPLVSANGFCNYRHMLAWHSKEEQGDE